MTVFVVQRHRRRDSQGEFKPVHDISDAERFGEIVELLSPTAWPEAITAETIIEDLWDKLSDYDPSTDYILALGNPVLIGWAMAVAAATGRGRVNVLVWDNLERAYIEVPGRVWPDEEALDDQEVDA